MDFKEGAKAVVNANRYVDSFLECNCSVSKRCSKDKWGLSWGCLGTLWRKISGPRFIDRSPNWCTIT